MTRFATTAAAVVLLLATTADAHPMGNFAVCHYARVRVHPDRVRVRYVLDLAELPTHAERLAMDRDRDGAVDADEQAAYLAAKRPELLAGLSLLADRRSVELVLVADELRFEPGAGGLPTMRIRLDAEAVLPPGGPTRRFEYCDHNFPTRAGWKEIVVEVGEGVVLRDSTAAAADRSRELTTYPPDQVPPQATEARWTAAADPTAHGSAADDLPPVAVSAATPRDAFTQAVLAPELGPWVVLSGLAIAFAFGSLHALAPGHGKTMVAAYLAGARGTAGHAVLLGLVVTLTHTAGVFALGAVALFATRYVMPEQLYPWLGAASGAMVCSVGGWLLYHRVRRMIRGPRPRTGTPHHHDLLDGPLTIRSLVALGVSGGLVPCPSALVVLLAAVALHRIAYGMLLITAFSLGLAAVLVAIGLMVVYARRWIDGISPRRGLLRGLGTVSALVITLIGIGLVARSLRDAL